MGKKYQEILDERRTQNRFIEKVSKAKNYQLKKWLREIIDEQRLQGLQKIEEIDWRDNDCLKEVLVEWKNYAIKVVLTE
jgi:hypothetical protein